MKRHTSYSGSMAKGGTPPAPAPPAPAPSARKVEVRQQERQTRRDNQKRRGAAETILAGESSAPEQNRGKRTLLGG